MKPSNRNEEELEEEEEEEEEELWGNLVGLSFIFGFLLGLRVRISVELRSAMTYYHVRHESPYTVHNSACLEITSRAHLI